MPQNASDPEHVNLMFFLVVYVLCLWLLSFLIRFRTYFKLRSVLLAEQEAVSSGRVDEAMYPGTFKGWDLDVDQDEWLCACKEGKYAPTVRGRQAFASTKSAVQEDAKARLQRRKAIQRRNADFDPDVVFHPGATKVIKRLVVLAKAFPMSMTAFRRLLGVQNPVRATGAHVNYFHMDVDQLLGKSLGRAVGDAADGVSGHNKGGVPVPLHPLKFTLSRPTLSIGGDAAVAGDLQAGSIAGTPTGPTPTTSSTNRRLRRRKNVGDEDVSTPSHTTSPPPIQSISSGEMAKRGSVEGGGTTLSCCPSLEVSDGAFGLPMKRQVPGYHLDTTTREAMVASGLRPLKIEIDVHRDIHPRDIHVSALLILSRQDLVVELWNSIARQVDDDSGLGSVGQEVGIGTENSHSNDRTPEITPSCSAPDFGAPTPKTGVREEPEGSTTKCNGSGLFARRSRGSHTEGSSLSLSREATIDMAPGGEDGGQFSQFVKQVSSASFQKGPPLSLVRDVNAKRARIADGSALEEITEGDAAAVPLTPVTLNYPPSSPGLATSPPSALQGAYRKVSFIQTLHCDQIEQMEMSFDEDNVDVLFPIVLVVEHKATASPSSSRIKGMGGGNNERGNTDATDDVALVYCGRIVGSSASASREDSTQSTIVIDFKLEYARIGGVLFGIESPVFNVGAPGHRSRQVPLNKFAGGMCNRRMEGSSSPLHGFLPIATSSGDGRNASSFSAPNTPWGSPSMAGTPRGAHTRTGSFHSCVSADSQNARHFRTSSLNESAISEDDSALCLVCFEGDRSVIFLPCGHFAVCEVCLVQLAHCPVCRTPIKEYLSLSTRPNVRSPSSTQLLPVVNTTTEGVGRALDRFVQRLRDLPGRIRSESHQRIPVADDQGEDMAPIPSQGPTIGEGLAQGDESQNVFPAAATLPRPQVTSNVLPPIEVVDPPNESSPIATSTVPPVTSPTHMSMNDLSNDERFQSLSSHGSDEELVRFHADAQPTSPGSSMASTTEIGRHRHSGISISGMDPLDATQELVDNGSSSAFPHHLGLRGVSPSYSVNTHRGTPTDPARHVDPTHMEGISEPYDEREKRPMDGDDEDDHSPPFE